MTNKQMAKRIQELEREVKELREQLLTLALRQPSVATVPVVQPITQPTYRPWEPSPWTVTYFNGKSQTCNKNGI